MRINQFIARATSLSRRAADAAVSAGRVTVNNKTASLGTIVGLDDEVKLDGRLLRLADNFQTIMLNKPTGYVCSRNGQGSPTIYELLPKELHALKPVGRLDKDSSGLLLLTNDGGLAHLLTHPKFFKQKIYEVELDKNLTESDYTKLKTGVKLEDGLSRLSLKGEGRQWAIVMHEGRNRQVRRTFASLGYFVTRLHRIQFGTYELNSLKVGEFDQFKI